MTEADKLRRLIAENKTDRALQILKAEMSGQPGFAKSIDHFVCLYDTPNQIS
jgi:hypothetical protein